MKTVEIETDVPISTVVQSAKPSRSDAIAGTMEVGTKVPERVQVECEANIKRER